LLSSPKFYHVHLNIYNSLLRYIYYTHCAKAGRLDKLVAMLCPKGLEMWFSKPSIGPSLVTKAYTVKPTKAIIANRPFLISFTSLVGLSNFSGSNGKVSITPNFPVSKKPTILLYSKNPNTINSTASNGANGTP